MLIFATHLQISHNKYNLFAGACLFIIKCFNAKHVYHCLAETGSKVERMCPIGDIKGATTLSITQFGITTYRIITFSITKFSTTTFSITTFSITIFSITTFSITILSITTLRIMTFKH